MTEMESTLVRAFNFYFQKNNISALAYRLFQSRYSRGQMIDFIIDSSEPKYYCAIEAKSMDASKVGTFNFKSRFDTTEKGFQLDREYAYCKLTGRKGFLAIEMRFGAGKPRECYFLPLEEVYKKYQTGEKSLKTKEIREFPRLERKKGKYEIPKNFFSAI